MADGSTKPISEVRVGDWVHAADPTTGEAGPRQVTDVIVGEGDKNLVEITAGGGTVTATDGHPFWVESQGAWVEARSLKVGDRLLLWSGSTAMIEASRRYSVNTVVYNLTVTELHTYFAVAGGEGVLVHNCGGLLPRPNVSDPSLQNRIDSIYKGSFGDGTTMSAARHELAGGARVAGRDHVAKALQERNALYNWLQANPLASYGDRLVAQSLLDDLASIVGSR